MNHIIESFNNVAIQMLNELRKIVPHSVILSNIDLIKDTVKSDDKKHLLIDNFVLHVLKYKNEIDEGDEDFFLKYEFISNDDDAGILKIIQEIKSMWKQIDDPDNKKSIFDYFRVLCFYAEKYFLMIDSES